MQIKYCEPVQFYFTESHGSEKSVLVISSSYLCGHIPGHKLLLIKELIKEGNQLSIHCSFISIPD